MSAGRRSAAGPASEAGERVSRSCLPSCPFSSDPAAPSAWQHRLRLLGLRAAGRALRGRSYSASSPEPLRILVIRPDHIGDLLFATPALRLLRQRYPSAHLSVLVGQWAVDVLHHGVQVDEVLTCDFPWFNRRPSGWPLAPYVELVREARRVRAGGYHIAVNLRFDFWWGALLASLAGVPQRLGYNTPVCLPFLSQFEPYQPGRHEVEQNLRLVGALAHLVDPEAPQPPLGGLEFHPTSGEEAEAEAVLSALGVRPGELLIAIHPGAGAAAKRWAVEGFAAVADALARQYGARVILTGSAGEWELTQEIIARSETKPRSLASRTRLGQLASVFRRCRLAIGVDSGAMHLAVAVGTPTIHLYGPSDPVACGPYGDPERHQVITAGVPCSPCGRFPGLPGEAECMRAIDVDRVLGAVEKALVGAGAAGGQARQLGQ